MITKYETQQLGMKLAFPSRNKNGGGELACRVDQDP